MTDTPISDQTDGQTNPPVPGQADTSPDAAGSPQDAGTAPEASSAAETSDAPQEAREGAESATFRAATEPDDRPDRSGAAGAAGGAAAPGRAGGGSLGPVETADADVTGVISELDSPTARAKLDEIHAFVKKVEPAIDNMISEVEHKGIGGIFGDIFGGMFSKRS